MRKTWKSGISAVGIGTLSRYDSSAQERTRWLKTRGRRHTPCFHSAIAPTWMAMALRGSTVALNKPPATVNRLPVQAPFSTTPPTTSQYTPSTSDTANEALHAASSLLIATNPSDPRPKAICDACGETQSEMDADRTMFLNPAIPATAGHRCWQSQPLPSPPLAEQLPAPKHMQQRTVSRFSGGWAGTCRHWVPPRPCR